jgi:hypothetical protein
MKCRAVLAPTTRAPAEAAVIASERDWHVFIDGLRDYLRRELEAGRCASAVVSLHFADEACDHE